MQQMIFLLLKWWYALFRSTVMKAQYFEILFLIFYVAERISVQFWRLVNRLSILIVKHSLLIDRMMLQERVGLNFRMNKLLIFLGISMRLDIHLSKILRKI